MPMRQQCLDAVSLVLGRRLTPREGADLIANIKGSMNRLRRSDPNWQTMSQDQRIRAAASDVANNYQLAAITKKKNIARQIVRQHELIGEMDRLGKERDIHAYNAVSKILQGVFARTHAITNEYVSQMMDTVNGIGSRFFGFVEDANDVRDFVYESYGVDTGNAKAKKAWKAFDNVATAMRQRAVNAGAEIGELDYNYLPQSHDRWKVHRMGEKDWVEFILPKLDRERYTSLDGNLMSDAEMRETLKKAYQDIVTSGSPDANLFEIAANRPQTMAGMKKYQSRVLHFADADAYLEYERQLGNGSMTGALIGHVSKMAGDISMMETLGPKPLASYDLLKFVAEKEANNVLGTQMNLSKRLKGEFRGYTDAQGLLRVDLDAIWKNLTGEVNIPPIGSEWVSRANQGLRNLEVAGKLGKAFISSFSDIPAYFMATGFNRLSFLDGFKYLGKTFGSDWKDYAARAGIIADSITSDFNRWGSDNIGQGWTSTMANATMKASFLTQWTDCVRRAFCLNMLGGIAKMTKNSWDDLDAYDQARLKENGISQTEWETIRKAGTDTFKGVEFASIEKIRALDQQAATKLLSMIIEESEIASVQGDLITRAEANRGAKKGTLGGEVMRSLMLFKSFPVAMMEKHWRRIKFLNEYGSRANQLEYIAALTVGTTIFGALSLQVQNLLNGKDFQDMDDHKFWTAALSKGGGLGFLSDVIVNGVTEDSRYGAWSSAVNLAGPVAGTIADTMNVGFKAAKNAAYDKETKPLSDVVRLTRSHVPFMNMWYTAAAIDRYAMNHLNEMLSPGYIARMETRARREWGQGYWWNPRNPDVVRAPTVADSPR